MSLINKAKELTGQATEMAGDLGGNDLVVKTIIRNVEKKDRINRLLAEKGCDYRTSGIDVENTIPPKAVFSIERTSE